MQAKIFAIMVLTWLEVIYAIKFGVLGWIIKNNKNDKTVEKAKKNVAMSEWIFAMIMLIKFIIETNIIQIIWPPLWFVDMLLTNASVIFLVVKHYKEMKMKSER